MNPSLVQYQLAKNDKSFPRRWDPVQITFQCQHVTWVTIVEDASISSASKQRRERLYHTSRENNLWRSHQQFWWEMMEFGHGAMSYMKLDLYQFGVHAKPSFTWLDSTAVVDDDLCWDHCTHHMETTSIFLSTNSQLRVISLFLVWCSLHRSW